MNKINKRGGFTYIEVVLSLALFLIALVALLPMFSHAGRNAAAAFEMYDANRRAYQMALMLRDKNFADARELAGEFAASHDAAFRIIFIEGSNILYAIYANGAAAHSPHHFDLDALGQRRMVAVMLYGANGNIIGRAITSG